MQEREISAGFFRYGTDLCGNAISEYKTGGLAVRKTILLLLLLSFLPTLSGCGGRAAIDSEPITTTETAPPDEPAQTEAPTVPSDEPPSVLFPAFVQPGLLLFSDGGSVPVELLSAESAVSYRIRYPSGSEATVGWDRIAPLVPEPPVLPPPTEEQTLAFLREELGDDLPDWILFVDLTRLTVTAVGNGEVLRVMPCSAGDAGHPTPRGRYEVDYKTEFMGKEGLYLCRWGVHYYGGYLLHSVLYTWRGDEILDGELSARISHGCVRLSPADSLWVYETAPLGAVVLVN